MCREQCTKRSAILAGLHIAACVCSLTTAGLLAGTKTVYPRGCPFGMKFKCDNNFPNIFLRFKFDSKPHTKSTVTPTPTMPPYIPDDGSGVDMLCDLSLYWALLSSALAFLFVMVNWVAGVHNGLKWQRWQFVLTFIGLAGIIVSCVVYTAGVVMWCNDLVHQTPGKGQGLSQFKKPATCLAAAKQWDACAQRGSESHRGQMTKMFQIVLPAQILIWITLILWQVMAALTIYITYRQWKEGSPTAYNPFENETNDDNNGQSLETGTDSMQPSSSGASYSPQNKHYNSYSNSYDQNYVR